MTSVQSHLNLGRSFLQANNIAGANREAGLALEADPSSGEACKLRFDILCAERKWKESLIWVDRWLGICPNDIGARVSEIKALHNNNKHELVRTKIGLFREDFPLARDWHLTMSVMVDVNSGKQSTTPRISDFRKSFKGNPFGAYVEGIAEYKKSHYIRAEKLFSKYLDACPADTDTLHLLASTAWRRGRFREARKRAQQLKDVAPEWAPRASELQLVSWIAYFPPFLLAHWVYHVPEIIASRLNAVARYAFILIFFVPIAFILSVQLDVFIEAVVPGSYPKTVWYGLMVAWWIYSFWGWQKWANWQLHRTKSMKLSSRY